MRCHAWIVLGAFAALSRTAAAAGPAPGAAPLAGSGSVLEVSAFIDGRSRLILHRNTARWDHLGFTAPGLSRDAGGNPVTQLNKLAWTPQWPHATPDSWHPDLSDTVRDVTPALPASPVTVGLKVVDGRGDVKIVQAPSAANDYTLLVDFDDGPIGGAAIYTVDLTYAPAGKDPGAPALRPVDAAPLRDGLALELLFSGNAADTSGHAAVAAVHSAALTADRHGKADSAYAFSGKDSYIVIAKPPPLAGEGLTVACWVRYDGPPDVNWSNCFVCQDNGKDRRTFQFSTCGSHVCWHRMGDPAADALSFHPVEQGAWHFIAATFDGLDHRLYFDGQPDDTREGTLTPNDNEPIYIGRKGSDEPEFNFHGAVDDVRIYTRPLTADEVGALYKED